MIEVRFYDRRPPLTIYDNEQQADDALVFENAIIVRFDADEDDNEGK